MLVALLATGLSAGAQGGGDNLDVYTGTVPAGDVDEIVDLGVDRHELEVMRSSSGKDGRVEIEAVLSGAQVAALRREGVELSLKRVDGQSVARRATLHGGE